MTTRGRMRVRLRTLMIAVAILGAGAAAVISLAAERRREEYRRRVESFAYGEAEILERIARALEDARVAEAAGTPEARVRAGELRAEAERLARLGAWHVRMERQYAWAIEHPWASPPPDLPPPGR